MSLLFYMFNKVQKKEMQRLAKSIIESEKWDALPWLDAWNGAYPLRPTKAEVKSEARVLEQKAARIITGASLEKEYSDIKEHIRMINLESAETFSIYALRRDS